MFQRRPPMTLQAHPNVVDIAEERRLREGELTGERVLLVNFVGIRAREPEVASSALPERRWRQKWLRAVLGLGKRWRAS